MKRLVFIFLALTALGCMAAEQKFSLAGNWRFQLDRADAGISGQWFNRALPDKIYLPGSLPAQGIGDDITLDTRWAGQIVDHSWFTAPQYAQYRAPGNIKIPFWLQPEKYYAGVAWFQREIQIPKKLVGQAHRSFVGAASLGNARVAGRPALRHERQPVHAARI